MTIVRRITGFALAFALLHLNAARVDAACPSHGTHSDAAPAVAVDHAAGDHGHAHDVDMPAAPADCDHPGSQDCCEAMTSCAPTLDLRADASDDVVQPARDPVIVAVASRPLSRTLAPEPPPPRA